MKILRLCLLSGMVAACKEQTEWSPEVQLKHQHEAAYQRQAKLLQAKEIKLSVVHAGQNGSTSTILDLLVVNPENQPEAPDSLRQRVRKLAHLVVADLATPGEYKAMNVQVTCQHGFFTPQTTSSRTFIYPLTSLQ